MIRYFNGLILYPLLELRARPNINPKLQELRQFESLSASEKGRIRKEAAYRLLSYCKAEIPYYRDAIQSSGLDIEKVRTDLKHIQDLPVLTKALVREHSERMKSSSHPPIHPRKTGGSTGQSVLFYYDQEGLDWTSAINLRAYELAGKRKWHADWHISAELDFGIPPFKARFMDWLKLFSQNRKRLMVGAFTDELMERAYRELRSRDAFLVQGHPSSMYAIARYIERKGYRPKRLFQVFEPSGEMITPKMVETIEKYTLAKVVNRYGNAEFGVMAHTRPSDPYNKLMVFDRTFYMEPVDAGSLVVTSFTNYGFPLLRYETGDIGTVKNEASGTFLYDIQGRMHDVILIDGVEYATHFIMDFFDHKVRGIREFQIVYRKDEETPVARIVLENTNDRERVLRETVHRFPRGLAVEFIGMEDLIFTGWRQKFRHIVDLRQS